jgi:hypothetical protein
MLRRIPKVFLLVALLAAFAASFRSGDRQLLPQAGCHFDQKISQCVNTSCRGTCG